MTEFAPALLIFVMLALMATRAYAPFRAAAPGDTLLEVPLGFVFRALDQRWNILALLAVLSLGSGLLGERWLPHGLFLLTLLMMAAILCIPVRYRITTHGVALNGRAFRPWQDFTGWNTRGNVVQLRGATRLGTLRLYAPYAYQERIGAVLRRYLPATNSGVKTAKARTKQREVRL